MTVRHLDRAKVLLARAAAQTVKNAKQIEAHAKEHNREMREMHSEHNREMREIRALFKDMLRRIAV